MEEFVVNDCGVCVNPIKLGVIQNKHKIIMCAIKVAKLDGKWYSAYPYEQDDHRGGGSSPCCKSYNQGFQTMAEAVQYMVHKFETSPLFSEKNRGNHKNLRKCLDKALEEVHLKEETGKQLLLFEL